jgi:hypothetical protein
MLTHHKPVSLSLMSLDLPLWSVVETAATLYQKAPDRFHLLFTEPLVQDFSAAPFPASPFPSAQIDGTTPVITLPQTPRLIWVELSPYRVTMTMQGNGKFSYRHFWEQGVYGLSRYWLQHEDLTRSDQLRLRNFTRSLTLSGHPLPRHLRVEYELWADQIQLGHYVMNLEIQS